MFLKLAGFGRQLVGNPRQLEGSSRKSLATATLVNRRRERRLLLPYGDYRAVVSKEQIRARTILLVASTTSSRVADFQRPVTGRRVFAETTERVGLFIRAANLRIFRRHISV